MSISSKFGWTKFQLLKKYYFKKYLEIWTKYYFPRFGQNSFSEIFGQNAVWTRYYSEKILFGQNTIWRQINSNVRFIVAVNKQNRNFLNVEVERFIVIKKGKIKFTNTVQCRQRGINLPSNGREISAKWNFRKNCQRSIS